MTFLANFKGLTEVEALTFTGRLNPAGKAKKIINEWLPLLDR